VLPTTSHYTLTTIHYHSLPFTTIHCHSLPFTTTHYYYCCYYSYHALLRPMATTTRYSPGPLLTHYRPLPFATIHYHSPLCTTTRYYHYCCYCCGYCYSYSYRALLGAMWFLMAPLVFAMHLGGSARWGALSAWVVSQARPPTETIGPPLITSPDLTSPYLSLP